MEGPRNAHVDLIKYSKNIDFCLLGTSPSYTPFCIALFSHFYPTYVSDMKVGFCVGFFLIIVVNFTLEYTGLKSFRHIKLKYRKATISIGRSFPLGSMHKFKSMY